MKGGALGFSTNRNERHMREDGKPIPSRLADDEEFFSLCDALGEMNAGVIQSNLGQYTRKHFVTSTGWFAGQGARVSDRR